MKPLIDRRRLVAALIAAGIAPEALAAAKPEKASSEEQEKDGEALTCGKEVVGAWLIEFDANSWRVMSKDAEIKWTLSTTLDEVVTHGFLVEAAYHRLSAGGYAYEDKTQVWFNVPSIQLFSSHGKPYYVFGKALGHSYHQSIGFGTLQYWLEENEFWYPEEGDFNTKVVLDNGKIAKKFIKELEHPKEGIRVELFAPTWSANTAVSRAEIVDMHGLEEAVQVAVERSKALKKLEAECYIPDTPDFEPPPKEGCYLTTATVGAIGLADDCWELRTLRKFRDNVLKATPAGQALVQDYYMRSPLIVDRINMRKDAHKIWRHVWLSGVLPAAVAAHCGLNKLAQTIYTRMTQKLARLAA